MATTTASATPQVVRFGVFELDMRAGELRRNGAKVKLEGQPLTILALLVDRPGEVVTREELKEKLWPADTFVDFEHSINVAVKRLREALQDSATTPRFIETLPRRGYRFIYPVRAGNEPSPEERAAERPLGGLGWKTAAGLALVVVVLLAGVALRDRIFGPQLHRPVQSVTVLPFNNLTGDEQQEFLADAITDALTTEMARVNKLVVPSVTSAMHYKHAQKPLGEISRDLRVEAAVEGSVQRSGNRLVINVQLIDARNDRHLWANSYERDAADLQPLLRAVARDLLQEMKVPLTNKELALLKTEPSANPQAVEAYLKGRHHLRRGTADDRIKARDLFQRAKELDPSYGAPYAQLAVLFAHGGAYLAGSSNKEGQAVTQRLATKALELDSTLGEAHRAMASVLAAQWDWAGAEREYLIARELGPNDSSAWYAQFLGSMRRFDEATTEAERVMRLDPASPEVVSHAAYPYFQAGRVDEAIRLWRQCLELDPNYWGAHNFLGRAYIKQGRYPEGMAEMRKAIELRGRDAQMDLAIVAYAYARSGQREQAIRILKDLEKAGAKPFSLVYAYVGLRDHDRAYQALVSAVERHGSVLAYMSTEPLYEELYLDPRYVPLMRRIGYPEAAVQNAVETARRSAAARIAQAR